MTNSARALTPLAPEAVWNVLKDLDTWPRWDTSMETVTDELGPELGPAITADFPDAMHALLAYAAT